MNVAVVAAAAMVVQDILAVCMVQAEAREHGWLAGILDSGMWLFALVTYHVSLDALNGHDQGRKLLVVGLVTAANLLGSKAGQLVGRRFITSPPDPLAALVAALTVRVDALDPPGAQP